MGDLATSSSQGAVGALIRLPPKWLTYWFAFSTVIVTWDAGYCFLRPRSMVGGDLSWIWGPYNSVPYGMIDFIYGQKALDDGNGFTNAQALMNVIECMLCLEYIYLRHTSPRSQRSETNQHRPPYHAHAPLVGFAASVMTLSKTALYILQDYFCGWCSVGHNPLDRLLLYFVVPNGIWIVVPLIAAIVLGRFAANALNREFASQIAYAEWVQDQAGSGTSTPSKPIRPMRSSERLRAQANGNGTGSVNASSSKPTSINRTPVTARATPSSGVKAAASPASSSKYPPVHGGAALPLTFHPNSLNTLVVGSNRIAAARVYTMLEADAKVLLASQNPLESLHEELRYRIEQEQLQRLQTSPEDLSSWVDLLSRNRISLVCVTDTLIGSSQRSLASATTIYQACLQLNIPVNISDHPALSTYTFPAVHRFPGVDGQPSNLQISVSTNGRGCRLSGRIKREIIAKLPSTVGAAVDNVGILRSRAKSVSRASRLSEEDLDTPLNNPVEQLSTPSLLSQASKSLGLLREASEDTKMRRMRWVHQMSEYYSFEALARMTEDQMESALETWSGTPRSSALPHHEGTPPQSPGLPPPFLQKGQILLVGSGPGHPSLLTVAALHALRTATLILSDKLVPAEVLALIPKSTELHIAKKFPGNAEGAQNEMMELALAGARRGETVVRLKQGDPFVYGRGGEEVLYFREHGFESTVIPGVSSALAGPLMMGIPVTQRGVADSLILCTGVGRAGKAVQLPGYARSRTLAILMGVARIKSIVEVLLSPSSPGRDGAAFPPHLPIAVIERASSPDQRVMLSTIEHIEEALRSVEERPPGMMLVGWAALCLEGKGRVDILDISEDEEEGVVRDWLGGQGWKIREGLGEAWQGLMIE